MDDSIFRQKGPDQFPRGIDNQAVDANPSELSGSTSVQRPVWEKFVTNTVAQENNQAAVRAENDQIRSAMRMGETWKGADGKLLRKVGRQSEMLDAEAFTDHPVAGPEARRSIWDREVRTWRKDAQDASFALRDPSFHSGAMTDKEREDALAEGAMLPETDPRHVELKSKLRADDDYRARKAELAQRSWDSEKKARDLESTDPESWWASRSQPKPSEQRAAVVADAQARAGEADAAADSATQELAGIDAKLAAGVRGSEIGALQSRRAEIATGQAVAAQEKAKAAEQVRGVQEQARESLSQATKGVRYPVTQPKGDDLEYFRQNPNVTGMAIGAGLNESPKDAPRTVVLNPFAKNPDGSPMSEQQKQAVVLNESIRHFMDESKPPLNFEPTKEQLAFFDGTEYGKPENRQRLKETIIARILTGDESAGNITPEQKKSADQVMAAFNGQQAKADSGDFMRGAEVSLRQIPQLAYGVAGLIGDTMEKTLGVGSSLRDWGLKGYADAEQKAAPLQRDHDDVTKAWAKAKTGDLGALVDWAQYGLGYAFGQLGETLAVSAIGGVAGAAAGTAAEPGGGTAVGGAGGALAGVVAKGATKSLAKGLIEKAIASQATKLAAKELAKDGVEATAEAITKRAADAAIRKAAAKEIGSNIAVMGNALGMEIGSIYPEAVKQAQAEGRELTGTDLARVWGTGIAAGGIEGLTDKLGIDLLKGKFADALPGGRIAGAAVGGLADAGVEAGTEAVQTGIERLGARQSLTDSEAQSDYINSAAMGAIGGAAVGGIGGAMEHGGNTPDAEHERVATELAALDPEAEPPSPDEIALGVMIAPRSPAEGVLVERELAQVEAEDDQAAADAAANVEAVKATGDAKATKAAEEGIAKIKPRAPLVRAVLKISGGMQADDLTDAERNAVGIAKSDSGEFSAMDDKELADAGIPGRMIDVGADGSIILTDGALKKVGEISPRARGLVKMTEAEAIQKAKERAAQQLSTDTQNGAQGDPAAGVFQPSEEGSVVPPHETNAAVGTNPNPNDNALVNQPPATAAANTEATGGNDPSAVAPDNGAETQLTQPNGPAAQTGTQGDGTGNAPTNQGAPAPGSGGVPAQAPVAEAHKRARVKLSKAKRKLKDRIIEGPERAITRPEGITINPKQIIDEALAKGMTDEQAGDYFDRVLDEEIRHLAQYDAAKALFRAAGSPGDFLPWMESHYAAIWQSDFVATGKDSIIRDLYANSQAEWDAMSDGNKALEAIRMMSQGDKVTEQGKLWADISEALKQAITAAIAALKQFRDIASPTIQSEITNLENALKQLNQSRPGDSKTGSQKPAASQKGDGTGGKAQTKRDSGTGGNGGIEPERRDGAGSPLVVGAKVEFTKNGKTRTGVVAIVQGGNVAVRPDDNPGIAVGVDVGDVRVIASPPEVTKAPSIASATSVPAKNETDENTPSASTPEVENQTPTPKTPWPSPKEKAEKAKAASPADSTDAAGEQSPVALTEAEQALKDAFKGMVDGLEASPLGESYTQGIPPEKIPQFITAAQKLIADGVTSPEGLAAALDKISPKLRVYSEAVWSAFRMVDPSLPVGVDWAGVYSDAAAPPVETVAAPAAEARSTPSLGTTGKAIWQGWKALTGVKVAPGTVVEARDVNNGGIYGWTGNDELVRLEKTKSGRNWIATMRPATKAEIEGLHESIDRGALQVEVRRITGAGGEWSSEDAGSLVQVIHQATGQPIAEFLETPEGKAWQKRMNAAVAKATGSTQEEPVEVVPAKQPKGEKIPTPPAETPVEAAAEVKGEMVNPSNRRPAKEIKAEIIKRVEEEIEKIPEIKSAFSQPKTKGGKLTLNGRIANINTLFSIVEKGMGWDIHAGLTPDSKNFIANVGGNIADLQKKAPYYMMLHVTGKKPETVEFSIPGDGTFKFIKDRGVLQEFLAKVKAMPVSDSVRAPIAKGYASPNFTKDMPLKRQDVILGLQDPEYRKKLVAAFNESTITSEEDRILREEGVTREELSGEAPAVPTASNPTPKSKPTVAEAGDAIKRAYPYMTVRTAAEERKFIAKAKANLEKLGIKGWQFDSAIESAKTEKARNANGKIVFINGGHILRELLKAGDIVQEMTKDELRADMKSFNERASEPTPSIPSDPSDTIAPEPVSNSNTPSEASESAPITDLESLLAFFRRIRSGETTAAEIKSQWQAYKAIEPEIQKEVMKMTMKELEKFQGIRKPDNKADAVRMAMDAFHGEFRPGAMFSYGGGVIGSRDKMNEAKAAAQEKAVAEWTDEIIQANAKERRDAAEARKKALENPETLDEWKQFVRRKGTTGLSPEEVKAFNAIRSPYDLEARIMARGESRLTPEQLAAYDEVRGIDRKAEIQAKKEREATVRGVKADTDSEIVETKHTKYGHDLFVVRLADRVEREVYNSLNAAAKKLGGRYSSYRGGGAVPGFQFKDRATAEQFQAITKGETVDRAEAVQERQTERKSAAAERLSALADRMDEVADKALNADRKTNTAKRAREAGYAEANANSMKAMATTMRNLADAIESGEATHLDGVRTRTHVETLNSLVEAAKREAMRAEGLSYAEEQKREGEPPTPAQMAKAEYPFPYLDQSRLLSLVELGRNTAGAKLLAERVAKINLRDTRGTGGGLVTNEQDIENVRELAQKVSERGKPVWDEIAWKFEKYDRVKAMGLTDLPMLRAALREFLQYRGTKAKLDPIKVMERDLVGMKIPGFFPTPQTVIEEMLDRAGDLEGKHVLEPSAGKGDIADAAKAAGADVDVIEQQSRLRDILSARGHRVIGSDFLDLKERGFTYGDTFRAPDGKEGIMRGQGGMGSDRVRLVREDGTEIGKYNRSELEGVEKRGANSGYDVILMNPPFEDGQDGEHVMRAYQFLKPGGKLVAITGEGIFGRSDKKSQAFRDWLDSVGGTNEKLPEGSFKSAFRPTGVSTRIVEIEKPTSLKSENSISKISLAINSTLSAEEKNAAAKELGETNWNDSARDSFISRLADWLVSGVEASAKLAVMFGKVAKNAALSIVSAISISNTTNSDAISVNTVSSDLSLAPTSRPEPMDLRPMIDRAKSIAGSIKMPNLRPAIDAAGRIAESINPKTDNRTNVEIMAYWVKSKGDNLGKPFAIADKNAGMVRFFDASGNPTAEIPALFGRRPGDEVITDGSVSHRTPAGRFNAEPYDSQDYGPTVRFDRVGNSNFLIHRIPSHSITASPAQRKSALESSSPDDNRITSGCINIDRKMVPQVTDHFKNGGVVYVLPETKSGKGLFEGFQGLRSSPLPETRKVIKINRELAENTRDLQRRFGKNIASGKLASFGNNRSRIEQDIVDAQYEHERTRKTNEDAMKVAKKRLEASRADVEEKLLKAAAGEDVSLDAADEMAFRYLINERSEQAGDDIEKHLENGKLRMALRLQRADLARRMQIGYDRLMTPAERAIEALSAAIYTPSGKVERYAEKLPASKRQEFMETAMRERLEKVEKALAKLGVTLGQVTGKNRDLQLANSKLMKDINKLRNVLEQGIIKMVQKGASLTDIKRRYGAIGFDQAQDVIQKAREELFAKINEMAKSGMSRDQIRDALKDGLKASPLAANSGMSPDEIWKMIEEDFGLPKEIPAQPITRTPRKKVEKAAESNPLTSDWSRPIFKKGMDEFDFDTKDREGIMQRVEVIRGLAGALGKIDGLTGEAKAKAMAKLDEINAILKKYGTDAAGIFAAAQGIEEYGFDVTDVAQVAAVSRAISMIDADIVDKASEWLYFSMLSGLQTMMVNATAAVPAAWESTVGRGFETAINLFFKDPMSAQLGESKYIIKAIRPALTRAWSNAQTAFAAQHPMFDRDVLAQEIDWERVMGGKGYRTGGSISGKWGDRIRIPMRILTATDDFNTTLMACVEVGTFAARIAKAKGMKPGSPEFNSFIEKEVNEAGSFSYVLATEKAKSAIFSNPLPGQHDPVTGKKVPVNDLGDAAGYLAGKITDTFSKEHDNLFVKTTFAAMRIAFFPFQRTPFNILRKGVRYTLNPFSLFDIGLGLVQNSRTANGKWEWNAKGRNPELIRRMAMQMQGAVLMLLVAGLAEGDDDDQDKPLVITGSAPFSPRGQAEREAGARSGLGPYRISFRRKDGSERFGFFYGRLEPLATTLAASIDIMKSIKRTLRGGGDATDAASAAMGGFVAQAQDKSFLKGVGDFTELVTNALAEPDLKDNRKMQQFLAGRVAMVMPNIIRQPIRESDSNFRERSAGFMQELLYQTVPTGQKPAKVDPYGQPVTKPGTALGRTIDVMDSGTNTVHPMDRMLLKFRDKHPDKAWFPSVVNSAEFTNRKTGKSEKMNPEQLAEFKRMAGLRLDAALKTARLNLNNPTERDIESAKELVQKSRSDAKKLLSFKYSR